MPISLNPSTLLNGSGINVSSLVQQVLSESSGQLTEWQDEQTTLQSQATDLTNINDDLSSLASAMQALSDPLGALTQLTANSSDTSILTATASSSASAATDQIVVNSQATEGLVYTNDFAAGANASILPSGATSGEIDLQIGGSSGTTQKIMITPGSNDTLTTLASYINSQNWGVTANAVTDANGSRLALTSQSTGSTGALAISSNNTSLVFNTPTGGANASISIDGVPYASASNTITGAIPGVTLNLVGADPNTTVQLTVGTDTSAVEQAVGNFVSAYNLVMSDINDEFTVNTATNSEGPLGSDSSLRSLQSSLMNDISYSVSGNGGLVNLETLGINMNDDGSLTLGTNAAGQTLDQVLSSNPSAFLNFFQNSTTTGFANNFSNDLNNMTNPTTGVISADLAQNQSEQQSLTDSINSFQTRLTAQKAALTTQFDQVDASLQAYPLLLQATTETLASMDSSSSSSSSAIPTLSSGL